MASPASNSSDMFTILDEHDSVLLDEERNEHALEAGSSKDDEINRHGPTDENDSPEALVRRENHFIMLLRVLAVAFLLVAAAITVTFVYLYVSKNQADRFNSEYDALSATIVSSLLLDTQRNVWMAHTLSRAVTLAMSTNRQPVTNFSLPPDLWNEISVEARFAAKHVAVSFIPFLYTDKERMEFEAFAREDAESKKGRDNELSVCHVCSGDPKLTVEDPSAKIELFGITYTCGYVYDGGLEGSIPAEYCPTVQQTLQSSCECGPSDGNVQQAEATWDIKDGLFKFQGDGHNATAVPQEFGRAPYAPMYAVAYTTHRGRQPLYNVLDDPVRADALSSVMFHGEASTTKMRKREGPYYRYASELMGEHTSDLYYPVFSADYHVVGAIGLEFLWTNFINGVVPANSDLVSLVIENSCGQAHSYSFDPDRTLLKLEGTADQHDIRYSKMVRSTSFDDYNEMLPSTGSPLSDAERCSYRFLVYPTRALESRYRNGEPALYSSVAGVIFIFSSVVFFFYDTMVRRRQRKVMASAKRTNDIVTSLFPENVRERLYERAAALDVDVMARDYEMENRRATGLHLDAANCNNVFGSDPIADLFPHTTVMFLDIAGFTAWSSEREPSQVFTLLENIYHAFDEVASQLGIFKVETIGDSYVAVAGLPKSRKDHAVGTFLQVEVKLFCCMLI
jgi:Adenylate and Guanylate cyclase catalytic domain